MLELDSWCESTAGGKKGATEMVAMFRRRKRNAIMPVGDRQCPFMWSIYAHAEDYGTPISKPQVNPMIMLCYFKERQLLQFLDNAILII